ncbi:DNA cytosine methyltransferase [Croceicoccus sp. F390]|uniref:DNA (cytosine-5-)-methyltransferase n=1 Tax=Croceicoccus esteveae TaxID=3075597 RepID=A0ABU2ZKH7_9SPHN|nr:DNA cytosine methyltransferase [Croceicoccus sp. F390]MDT0576711.1 DNA cytosine methyltransferase [Croceicoccus sp. F390]
MSLTVGQGGSTIGKRELPALRCVDLFAGAGGFSLAAQQAGFEVSLAIEHDRHAAATYRRNLVRGRRATRLIEADIRKLDPCLLARQTLKRRGPVHLMLGGPPCQGFSSHRLKDAGVSDQRNDLIHTYFDFVRAFEPRAFLMENVPGMLWPRHDAALARFYDEGRAAGYRMLEPIVLDARNHGVPQRRRRVFILGVTPDAVQRDLSWPPLPTHAPNGENGLLPWRDCNTAFLPAAAGDPNDLHMNHSAELVAAFARTPANGGSRHQSGRVLECHQGHDGHNDVYGRIDPAKPAPTMTTACINPSKGRFVHPVENHGITLRQAARIQTFPDSFIFTGGLIAAGSQIGNAVPVNLGRVLLEHLRTQIKFTASKPHPENLSGCRSVTDKADGLSFGKIAEVQLPPFVGPIGPADNQQKDVEYETAPAAG